MFKCREIITIQRQHGSKEEPVRKNCCSRKTGHCTLQKKENKKRKENKTKQMEQKFSNAHGFNDISMALRGRAATH
jgi:hypothetical protein